VESTQKLGAAIFQTCGGKKQSFLLFADQFWEKCFNNQLIKKYKK